MKKYTNEELKTILENMKQGGIYCGIYQGYGTGAIYISNGCIRWSHFGESAEKISVFNLGWLLNVIFKDCELITDAEYSDYHLNYIPKDKRYKGVDLSASHPNVLGV